MTGGRLYRFRSEWMSTFLVWPGLEPSCRQADLVDDERDELVHVFRNAIDGMPVDALEEDR